MTETRLIALETRVHDAIEAIYQEFLAPIPRAIEGCPCCVSSRKTDALLGTPLRKISGQTLWRYVSGAFLTVGGQQDFRYLLPRILDISVFDHRNANDPEIVLGKLSLAEWRLWPANERLVIEEFIDAWFEYALFSDLAEARDGWIGGSAEGVLCGATRAGLPLERWLPRLAEPDAAPVLADLRKRFLDEPSGFWEDVPGAFKELRAFLGQGQA